MTCDQLKNVCEIWNQLHLTFGDTYAKMMAEKTLVKLKNMEAKSVRDRNSLEN